jgi:hypothetical protein
MRLYVLDTSLVGFAQQLDPVYLRHLQSLPDGTPVVTTIITVGEDLSGWLPTCRRATDGESRVKAYARLQGAQEFYQEMGSRRFDRPDLSAWIRFISEIRVLFRALCSPNRDDMLLSAADHEIP